MRKPWIIAILFLSLSPNLLWAQPEWDTTWTAQLDEDRILDTIFFHRSSGSGGGYAFADVKFTSREAIKVEKSWYFNNMTSFAQLPAGVTANDNEPWVKELKPMFGSSQKPDNKPDASLNWLIDANFNSRENGTKSFERVIRYDPIWTGEPFGDPASYTLTLRGKEWKELYDNWGFTFEVLNGPLPEVTWMSYSSTGHLIYGNLQKDQVLKPYIEDIDYEVHATYHGLLISRNGKYSWCFISEGVTDGPNKLRWGSINQVERWGKYIVLLQNAVEFSQQLWIIDPEAGIAALFGHQFDRSAHLESGTVHPSPWGRRGVERKKSFVIRNGVLYTLPREVDEWSKPDTIPLRPLIPEMDSIAASPWSR